MTEINENINSPISGLEEPEASLQHITEPNVHRSGRRGRPNGTGRKHAEGAKPRTFRNFTPTAGHLLSRLMLGAQLKQNQEEIIEEALIRLALARESEIPGIGAYLRSIGR